jgi:DnaJ-class molecular chaperone
VTTASWIALTFIAAAVAAVWFIRLRVLRTCSACNGWLTPVVRSEAICDVCDGNGLVPADERAAVAARRQRERTPEEEVEVVGYVLRR